MPCAAACSAKLEIPAASSLVASPSQVPKLSLMTSAKLLSMMYNSDKSTPSVVMVDWETTSATHAVGATDPAQVVSKTASLSSSPPRSPGSGPFRMTCADSAWSKVQKWK